MFWVGVLLMELWGCLYLKLILPVVPASFKKATIVYMITILFMSLMAYVNIDQNNEYLVMAWINCILDF